MIIINNNVKSLCSPSQHSCASTPCCRHPSPAPSCTSFTLSSPRLKASLLSLRPWVAAASKRRKTAATAVNRPAVASYMAIVDIESKCSIHDIYWDSNRGTEEINLKLYFHRFALNTVSPALYQFLTIESLTLNPRTRMSSIHNAVLREIITISF